MSFLDGEKQPRYEDQEESPQHEYNALVEYIQNVELRKGDDNVEEAEEIHYRRPWYAPWKKIEIRQQGKSVPEDWYTADIRHGISSSDVEPRRRQFGFNELESPEENLVLKFIGFFRGPVLYVMEGAVGLAGGLREWVDFGVIIGILLLNAFVGFYQEKQAGDIVAQLKKGIALRTTVIRDGEEREVEARELVPGDIVVIEEGATIPADCELLADYKDKDGSRATEILQKVKAESKKEKSDDEEDSYGKGPSILAADQSAITGESLAVDKYHGDMAFYTTICKRGKVFARVKSTAPISFVGKTAALVLGSNEKGHFVKVMNIIGGTLLVLVIVFLFAVWIGGFFRNIDIAQPRDNNLLVYTLIFAVIGVPVGLPVVTTTTLAVGAAYLAKKQAIVQKLTSIESLAGCDILCSDKTGTLTANKLSIHEPYTAEGVDMDWMMCVAALASSHNVKSLDPIDKITISTLKEYPRATDMLKTGWVTKDFRPFDPVSKRITSIVERDGVTYTCAKGAPNSILKMCATPPQVAQAFRDQTMEFASRGFRSLGVSVQEGNGDWQVLGLLPMFDPPRHDTAATVGEAIKLGVGVKMLTGDAVAIAKETCKMLGMGTNVYDSHRLIGGGSMAGSEMHDFIENADGFGEVFPEHKYQIVEMLQHRGHLTAMTGDGVNDAPALKKADCGIAVEGASDAARSAAAVVFLDEGLSTIITAIKVAREIFHRMKAYIVYRIALCLHLEIYLTLSILIMNETIRADLIVWIALFADLATVAVAYDNAPYALTPVEWQLPKIWIMSTVLGFILAGGTWILRGTLFLNNGGVIQNWGGVEHILFLEVCLTENWLIFLTRTGEGEFKWPSWQLTGAIAGVDIIATLFTLFGWFHADRDAHNGHTDIVTVVKVWAFSIAVMVVCTLAYIIMNNMKWLNNVGRKQRGKIDRRVEDFMNELQRITIVHERSDRDVYRLYGRTQGLDSEN
ncbi:plasma-membrane proton-e [Wallemia mellicola]|uniref:Plasma membrane ATPase n=2 Tax=Wallemia mellicola TaxID=1708541 RepID=A0A4T0T3A2_9BASI|nr:plasma-membrane proton-e [Wallemia mellicola CBS 633.66]TIB68323.1 hypothetical protein E3Q24_03732 [Wallemia mellicola]EIM19139.1 plasma-membrane proton-e [Wallemia mellicola CBS 633.66]TIB71365.1 hypothetical protein E3Q23_03815 [Wallemia mellicola]TIB75735.1 plasma-membrane proton-e [Wallemia mellicola]TIB80320.1 plasma-membrane proton-e [Wallemia mellicola]|eukprot:XP_006960801.1 plasma-membrane proton-e [Wallemia mellicola CBS 633.66]